MYIWLKNASKAKLWIPVVQSLIEISLKSQTLKCHIVPTFAEILIKKSLKNKSMSSSLSSSSSSSVAPWTSWRPRWRCYSQRLCSSRMGREWKKSPSVIKKVKGTEGFQTWGGKHKNKHQSTLHPRHPNDVRLLKELDDEMRRSYDPRVVQPRHGFNVNNNLKTLIFSSIVQTQNPLHPFFTFTVVIDEFLNWCPVHFGNQSIAKRRCNSPTPSKLHTVENY